MTFKNDIHVYFMPGMCANSLIFERIKLNPSFKLHYLEWIPPLKKESLSNYVVRLSNNIKHDNPILIGVSFGGVIVQELSKRMCQNASTGEKQCSTYAVSFKKAESLLAAAEKQNKEKMV